MSGPVRLLVVDDSEIFTAMFSSAIERSQGVELVGIARTGAEGVALTRSLRPDVISMDVFMPEMDGLEAVEHIMDECPTPIAMVTAASDEEMSGIGFRAIGSGALDVLSKPSHANEALDIVNRLRILARVKTRRFPRRQARAASSPPPARPARVAAVPPAVPAAGVAVVGIAISTGGPPVLQRLLRELPAAFRAPLVIVQHTSEGFDGQLVDWLASSTGYDVRLARTGDRIEGRAAWIAPWNQHLVVKMGGRLQLDGTRERVDGHRPSGTVLLESLANTYGARAAGIVLTGMGADGARGLLALREAGGVTAAQDAASSLVDGMPQSAREMGAAEHVVSLDGLAAFVARVGAAP